MNSFGAEEEGSTNRRSHCFPKGKSSSTEFNHLSVTDIQIVSSWKHILTEVETGQPKFYKQFKVFEGNAECDWQPVAFIAC